MTNFSKFRNQFKPFIKYCTVGASGTLIDVFSLYIFIDYLKLPLLSGTTFAFLLAMTNNFVLNKTWTFQNRSKNFKKLYIKFFIVSIVGLILTNLSMYLQVKILNIWYIYAKFISSGIVLTWNFLGNKYWIFSIKERKIIIPKSFPFLLSIIIPAYNEENRIKSTLLTIFDFLEENKINSEVLVVNDGSKDKTLKIVNSKKEKFKNLSVVSLKKNRGKGYAIKKGIEKANGQYILIADADNSTPIEELLKLMKFIKREFDIVIGSRYLKSSEIKIRQPFFRVAIGRIGNILIQMFLVNDIKDTQCGFKIFKHGIAKEIFSRQKVKRWGFDMEALAIAQMLDYKIKEVPVSWINSPDTRLRPIRDTLRTFVELIYIKLNLMSGRYID